MGQMELQVTMVPLPEQEMKSHARLVLRPYPRRVA